MAVNRHKDIVIKKYEECDEDARLVADRAHNIEYLTTMRYIQKFLKKGDRILEIGAGTGRCSVALAKMGFDVTAVDLTPKHVEIMNHKAQKLKNFRCLVADALDLSMFEDKSFDMVLNFGPMYHLFHQKDKKRAIAETLRVAKKNAICLFAYIPCATIAVDFGLRRQAFEHLYSLWINLGDQKIFRMRYLIAFILKILRSCLKKQIQNMSLMLQQTAWLQFCRNGLNNCPKRLIRPS